MVSGSAVHHLDRLSTLHRGDAQPLPRGVDLKQVRPDGDAVQAGQLAGKDAALQSGVDGLDLGLFPVLFPEHLRHPLPQGGVLPVLPAGIVPSKLHRSPQLLHQAGQAVLQHLPLGVHRTAHAEGGPQGGLRRG